MKTITLLAFTILLTACSHPPKPQKGGSLIFPVPGQAQPTNIQLPENTAEKTPVSYTREVDYAPIVQTAQLPQTQPIQPQLQPVRVRENFNATVAPNQDQATIIEAAKDHASVILAVLGALIYLAIGGFAYYKGYPVLIPAICLIGAVTTLATQSLLFGTLPLILIVIVYLVLKAKL